MSFREKEIGLVIQYKDEKGIKLRMKIGDMLKGGATQLEGYTVKIGYISK